MTWSQKREVMQRYDESAPLYNMQYSGEQKAKIESALKNLNLPKNCVLLDVGCGTGLLFPYVEKVASLIVGLDVSKGMLREAKKCMDSFANVVLICGDADHMPFLYGCFDVVFAVTLLQNMPNPPSTLNEIELVSKNSAVMVVTGLKKEFSFEGFVELLKDAGLVIENVEDNEHLKGYVVICTQTHKSEM